LTQHSPVFLTAQRIWRRRDSRWARYLLATALPLAGIFLAVQLAMPAFIFEHLTVLLVVGLAMLGGRGPAILVAVVASVGDNILLREPIGRPAIDGFRDVIDFGLFLIVAGTVGWLVNRLQAAKQEAQGAAQRERRAREQRDQLIATVTHDLATPLTAIQGTIQLVRKNASLAALDLPRLLVRIETAAGRATSLVRTLRDVRSLEDDVLALDFQRTDLRTIVEPTVCMLDRMSDQHPMALMMASAPLLVDCDVERIGRVVENLVTNAIKYSPDGGPVEVSAVEQDRFAILRVADSGIGVPSVDCRRVFELGYRADEAAAVAPGLGLGLYIAAAIVGRHGGTIEAAPRDSGGSLFTVRLPLAGPSHGSDGSPEHAQSRGAPYQFAS
jgi:signal transduction histidine kinase